MNNNFTHAASKREATTTSLLDDALQAIDRAEAGNQTGHVERGHQYATAAEAARHHAANDNPELAAAHWTVADTLVGPLDTADADQLRDFIAGAVNWDERRLHYILDQADIATREKHAEETGASTSGDSNDQETSNRNDPSGIPGLCDSPMETAHYFIGRIFGILGVVLAYPDRRTQLLNVLDLVAAQGPWSNPHLPRHLQDATQAGTLGGKLEATRAVRDLTETQPEDDPFAGGSAH